MNHRQAKREIKRTIRFAHPRFSPAFAQRLQGRHVMDRALSRGEEYAGKQWFRQEMDKHISDTTPALDWDEFVASLPRLK